MGRREVFGIEAEALNDDPIGRALDAIAPEQERISGTVGAQAIARFGVEVTRLHWDMTSISLHGAYEEPEPGFATPRLGQTDGSPAGPQAVPTWLPVTAQEGIPLWHGPYDGGPARCLRWWAPCRCCRSWPASSGSCWYGTPS